MISVGLETGVTPSKLPFRTVGCVRIDELNALPPSDAASALRAAADIDSFVTALVDARPYDDVDTLLEIAREQSRAWTAAEVEHALAGHPRIGERPTDAHSAREQASVGQDADLRERLRVGNAAYEQRFGRIYLVRAAGRSGEEMLELLERRLGNDPAVELEVTSQELAQIALLRLEGMFR